MFIGLINQQDYYKDYNREEDQEEDEEDQEEEEEDERNVFFAETDLVEQRFYKN